MSSDKVPSLNHMFQIDIVGKVTKKRFLGEFTCRVPTMKDQALIGKYETMLNGDNPIYLNSGILKLHKWISYCKYTLVEVPKFWENSEGGYTLFDSNVVEAVYDEILAYEQKWYNEIWGVKEFEAEIESARTEEKEEETTGSVQES